MLAGLVFNIGVADERLLEYGTVIECLLDAAMTR